MMGRKANGLPRVSFNNNDVLLSLYYTKPIFSSLLPNSIK